METDADACMELLEAEETIPISAGTVAEALIVAAPRGIGVEMDDLIAGLGIEVVGVTEAGARRVADAYDHWGKGIHQAALNLGDCFADALAAEHSCPLLFVGSDFARTDLKSAR